MSEFDLQTLKSARTWLQAGFYVLMMTTAVFFLCLTVIGWTGVGPVLYRLAWLSLWSGGACLAGAIILGWIIERIESRNE